MQILAPVATNVITGFLGVGKTTAIRALMALKPASQRWAILINEFGEIGLDAALLGEDAADSGIFLRELPGGCLCCAAGVPLQVALNQLLRHARPDRLLIEPTGLGHPQEIIDTLDSAYRGVLDMRATVTLVDARRCHDARYREHAVFREQLQVADLVVANKMDLCTTADLDALSDYLATIRPQADGESVEIVAAVQGQLDPAWLEQPGGRGRLSLALTAQLEEWVASEDAVSLPECGYLRLDNSNGEYHSSGWLFDPAIEFSYPALYALLSGLAGVERMKGVFITDEGVAAFNYVDGVVGCTFRDECADSRVEVIGRDPEQWLHLEQGLLDCRRNS